MKRTDLELLNNLRIRGGATIAHVSEAYRQRLIGWAMQEPPLVDVDGPRVSVTAAGEALLRREGLMT
ncbi:hypothetical protein ACWX0K_10905 [Nitrobacteraceae bacterium UC4446_H13]